MEMTNKEKASDETAASTSERVGGSYDWARAF